MKRNFSQMSYDGICKELERLFANYRWLEAQQWVTQRERDDALRHRDEWQEWGIAAYEGRAEGAGVLMPNDRLDWEGER